MAVFLKLTIQYTIHIQVSLANYCSGFYFRQFCNIQLKSHYDEVDRAQLQLLTCERKEKENLDISVLIL